MSYIMSYIKILTIIQLVISLLLIGTILLQQRGGGLSPVLGGGESFATRRGVEKKVFIATIILSILFLATSLLTILL